MESVNPVDWLCDKSISLIMPHNNNKKNNLQL